MICPDCGKIYAVTLEHEEKRSEGKRKWTARYYKRTCCNKYPIRVEYIWNNCDPDQGQLLDANEKTKSAMIYTDNYSIIRTKRWWYPKKEVS